MAKPFENVSKPPKIAKRIVGNDGRFCLVSEMELKEEEETKKTRQEFFEEDLTDFSNFQIPKKGNRENIATNIVNTRKSEFCKSALDALGAEQLKEQGDGTLGAE